MIALGRPFVRRPGALRLVFRRTTCAAGASVRCGSGDRTEFLCAGRADVCTVAATIAGKGSGRGTGTLCVF